MEHYQLYLSGLIYKAFELKRTAQQYGRLDMTQDQFSSYYSLVINELEKARAVANAFSYEIINYGEPEIKIQNTEFIKKLRETTYFYDPSTGLYTTYSDRFSLSNKALQTTPRQLRTYFTPAGHEYALGMFPPPKHNDLSNAINPPEPGSDE